MDAMAEYELLSNRAQAQLPHFKFGPIWDGNLNSKAARDELVACGLLERAEGFQFLTAKAVRLLVALGQLNESTWKGARPFVDPPSNVERFGGHQ